MSAGELAPLIGIYRADWRRVTNQTAIESNSGETDVIELGFPYWEADVSVRCHDRATFDLWDAFFARREGFDVTFTMPRTFRRRPADRSISDDTGLSLTSATPGNSRLVLAGWGADKYAAAGDMISYRTEGDGYWIGQVTAPQAAGVQGNIGLQVWPRPLPPHASEPLPRRINAVGEFRLSEAPDPTEAHQKREWKFKARQVLRVSS